MKVTFLTDDKRIRAGKVAHEFKSGKSYDLRDDIAAHFIRRGKAVSGDVKGVKAKADVEKVAESNVGDDNAPDTTASKSGGSKAASKG